AAGCGPRPARLARLVPGSGRARRHARRTARLQRLDRRAGSGGIRLRRSTRTREDRHHLPGIRAAGATTGSGNAGALELPRGVSGPPASAAGGSGRCGLVAAGCGGGDLGRGKPRTHLSLRCRSDVSRDRTAIPGISEIATYVAPTTKPIEAPIEPFNAHRTLSAPRGTRFSPPPFGTLARCA